MENELKLLARWEADRKRLKAKHIKALADLDARWGRTMAGYENTIKGNPDLENLLSSWADKAEAHQQSKPLCG